MNWLEAFVLALIQGLTEFLPISSSAHLILPSQLFGWEDQGLAFDVAVHVGTLLAIVLYFRSEIGRLFVAWLGTLKFARASQETKRSSEDAKLAWLLILATLPAGLAGLYFDTFISENLRSTAVIAGTTIIFGLALWFADARGQRDRTLDSLTIRSALLIGLSQALALVPGTSRSGVTMTAALLLGFSREASARFSFLMSVPLITMAGMLKTKELLETGTETQLQIVVFATVVAFVSAYFCIHYFLQFLERIGFMPFVVYRLLLGFVLIVLMLVA